MLASVINARDRFLAPGGAIVPSAASIFICPVSMRAYHECNVAYWRNLYGFNYGAFSRALDWSRRSQPLIETVPEAECLAEPQLVVRLDLAFVETDDIQNIVCAPKFVITKNDLLRAFAVWFTVEFDSGEGRAIVLSTAPGQPETHWKQTVLILPNTLLVSKAEEVRCNLLLSRDATNGRSYNITVEVPEVCDDQEDDDDDDAGMGECDDVTMDDGEEVKIDREDMANAEVDQSLKEIITNTMNSKLAKFQ